MKRLAVLFLLLAFAVPSWAQGKGYVPLTPEKRKTLYMKSLKAHGSRLKMLAQNQELPASFDCRDKGWVLPIGDQGGCGSCYLYSTVYGTATQAFVKAGYGKADGSFVLSVQYGMDCHNFGGCNGGNGTEVIDWMCDNGWPAEKWVDTDGKTHADYPPYEARSRTCRKVPGAKDWRPASWGFVAASSSRPATALEVKTALYNFGALNVSLDAGGQFGNGTGTITSLGNSIDHEIEIVAWDDAKDGGAFLLKNQWSKSWGNSGYRWVTYKAAQHLVDVFFVTAAVLPPPPPPPPDPGPGPAPIGLNSIVITIDGKSKTWLLTDPDQHRADADALEAILQRMRGTQAKPEAKPEAMPEKKPEPPPMKLPEGPKEEKKPPQVKPPKVIDGAIDAFDQRWRTRMEEETREATEHDRHLLSARHFDEWWAARMQVERAGK